MGKIIVVVNFWSVQRTGNTEQEEGGTYTVSFPCHAALKDIWKLVLKGLNGNLLICWHKNSKLLSEWILLNWAEFRLAKWWLMSGWV